LCFISFLPNGPWLMPRAAGKWFVRGPARETQSMTMSLDRRADGYESASLAVDADSLTGAVRLYEHVGFAVDTTWITYSKQLG
jgi:hypothetical protein